MTESKKENSVVAVYETHEGAESGVQALEKAGLDMKRLSIIGKDFHTEEHARGYYSTGDRVKFWGGQGAFWGTIWGMLFGGGFFFLPAVGPVIVLGPLVGWIVGALEGMAVGGAAGVLGAALTSIGIPKDSVIQYETEVKAGKFLLIANGDANMIETARGVLHVTKPFQMNAHAA